MRRPAKLADWMARPWFLTLWCVIAAFGAYASMYGFRKPFTAGSYGGAEGKTWLVTAQVLGYMLSKFIGIKVIAEMTAERRARAFLSLIAIAEAALLLFAITPAPFHAGWLFVNGLSLGMVFGLVLGFVEGRCLTELFVAGLCASFIVADGFTKSIGSLLLRSGLSERWMPCVAGLLFVPPLLVFVWMLEQVPAATAQDKAARSPRSPMTGAERLTMVRRHGFGLGGLMFAYLLITILRSIRADFAAEVWAGLGHGNQPAIFTQSELWVTLAVVLTNGALVLVNDNRRAFFGGLGLAATGLGVALLALACYRNGFLRPFPFMVLLGVGMYVPYIAVHTTLFERFIALTRERGNIGYLMYLADSLGYLGYVAVMLTRGAVSPTEDFLSSFLSLGTGVLGAAFLALLGACAFYSRRSHEWGEHVHEAHTRTSVP